MSDKKPEADFELIPFAFDEAKAIAALTLLLQAAGGAIDKYKASRLLYLFDRNSLLTTGRPAFYGRYYTMAQGPLVGEINDGINTAAKDSISGSHCWRDYFSLVGRELKLVEAGDIKVLNETERGRLTALNQQFNHYSFGKMKDHMLRLPENIRITPERKIVPLSYRHVMKTNRLSDEAIEAALAEITRRTERP